jgi:peptidoglycan/xylan/chitin deacetylase (PgdA/CDA1 family)
MNKYFLALALIVAVNANAKEIALTFDDCPRRTDKLMTGMERAQKLTAQLEKHGIKQAAFFCNSPDKAPDGPQRLKHFASRGHIIANHSATHPSLSKTPASIYKKDISKADQQLKDYPNFRKWFRYPFLHEGKTEKTRDEIRKYLAKHKYLNAYVTVDNADYYMDDLLRKAVAAGRKWDDEKLCGVYRDILKDDVAFHDELSVKTLGRSVKHVLLLHETDLNALCIGSVIQGLRDGGWTIITADEAFSDPISEREPNTLFLGQGRVAALAKEKGYPGPLFSKWNEFEAIDGEFLRRGVFE